MQSLDLKLKKKRITQVLNGVGTIRGWKPMGWGREKREGKG
jgi:hypothetical protein